MYLKFTSNWDGSPMFLLVKFRHSTWEVPRTEMGPRRNPGERLPLAEPWRSHLLNGRDVSTKHRGDPHADHYFKRAENFTRMEVRSLGFPLSQAILGLSQESPTSLGFPPGKDPGARPAQGGGAG